MQRTESKIRMLWWFWPAIVFGMLSFVPLIIAGYQMKKWLWMALGIVQLMWLWLSPRSGDEGLSCVFIWFSIGLGVYVFTYVRRKYVTEHENISH